VASPHVAGTAALVWAANPGWTNSEVRQRLIETATDLGAAGRDTWYGYGLVNAASAAAPPPPPPTTGTMVVRKTVVGPAPTTAWEFTGTSPIGTFQLPAGGGDRTFASLPAGPYTITETPKDGYSVTYKVNDGSTQSGTSATVSLTAGATVTVEFINTYTAPIPMWVSSIGMRLVVPNKNFTYATATVTVVDSTGPVAGATVTGRWSGATSATVSGTTDATGKVTFQSGQVRKPPSGTIFTFCVTNITKTGWTYDSNRNVETCDSVRVP